MSMCHLGKLYCYAAFTFKTRKITGEIDYKIVNDRILLLMQDFFVFRFPYDAMGRHILERRTSFLNKHKHERKKNKGTVIPVVKEPPRTKEDYKTHS